MAQGRENHSFRVGFPCASGPPQMVAKRWISDHGSNGEEGTSWLDDRVGCEPLDWRQINSVEYKEIMTRSQCDLRLRSRRTREDYRVEFISFEVQLWRFSQIFHYFSVFLCIPCVNGKVGSQGFSPAPGPSVCKQVASVPWSFLQWLFRRSAGRWRDSARSQRAQEGDWTNNVDRLKSHSMATEREGSQR